MNSMELDSSTKRNVDLWLNGHYDEVTKAAIRDMLRDNPQEIVNAFYTTLTFGTGGLRGLMGVGCNRINLYTIMTATQGLANYINKQDSPQNGHAVYIGYDSRHHSRLFAEATAKVLAGNGIRVYLSKELRPTPLISFGLRAKSCTAGVIITASHNPPEYNGYKVYWKDGGQILPPHDSGIIKEINAIADINAIKKTDSLQHPLIEDVAEEMDKAYIQAVDSLQNYPKENHAYGHRLKVVYANLHGTGITLMPQTLAQWGFTNLTLVEEQAKPDGNFPTVDSPNPEDQEALKLGIETMIRVDGDILIACDPDADRLAVAVKHQDAVHLINGNQIACLCLDHICKAFSSRNAWPERAAFIKTIATTELFQSIAEAYHRPCFNVLTGFKYIAGVIHQWEADPKGHKFIFGGEESYGYLLGTQTRDKDAILSGALICEVALHASLQGKTLIDQLHDLYRTHGVYHEKLLSVNFEETKSGKEQMARGMVQLRTAPPDTISGIPVATFEDYHKGVRTDLSTGKQDTLMFPKSNMMVFWLKDGSKLVVRPSGTEPKIKVYCGVVSKMTQNISKATEECEVRAQNLLTAMHSQLHL